MQQLIRNEALSDFTEAETDQAFQIAKRKQLPVLVDFWAPVCKGCKKMELTTYQSSEILAYIHKNFVFVKYDITNRNTEKIQCSPILWTPCFIVFANDRSEVRKISGYLNNAQFQGEMEIGRALAFVRKGQSHAALELLENFIATTTNESLRPEALYWAGVASFFLNKRNPESLTPFWKKLMIEYRSSEWADKADCLDVVIQ